MFDEWVAAENFYTFTIPLVLILLALLFFEYVFFLSYIGDKRKVRKIGNFTVILAVISCVLYFINGHVQYQFWVEQNEFIHAGIREYSFILGMKSVEEPQVVQSLGRSNALYTNLIELDMYEKTTVTHSFNHAYVGSRGNDHYFSFGEANQYVYRIRGKINWKSDKSEIRGTVFSLTDKRFRDLGFIDDFDVVFEALDVPYELKDEVDIKDNQRILSIDDVYGNWIFSEQRF